MHTHKAIKTKSRDYGWSHCLTPEQCAAHPERQDAHGNIVRLDICSCGAYRATEINGAAKNHGPWMEATNA